MFSRRFLPVLLLAFAGASPLASSPTGAPFSGPAAGVRVTDSLSLADFKTEAPPKDAPREFRLVLPEAITLTDIEKHGIKGGGGVRKVPVKVYGDITLLMPVHDGKVDYEKSTGEVNFLGVNRIGFRGPLENDPENPLTISDGKARGTVRFPVSIREPGRTEPREFVLNIELDLEIKEETFTYTPDPDPSIPPWRSDKSHPSGFKVVGTWKTIESRPEIRIELEGKIRGSRGSYRLSPVTGHFFPVATAELSQQKDGMQMTAFNAGHRVDGHESQWAVKVLPEPVDLSRFNGLRLRVHSAEPAAGKPIPAAVAVAFRVKGQPWFACRTVAPLLGGDRDHIVDFPLFARGTANPGHGGGPNMFEFPDLSQVDAIAIGVANPFGVGDVTFTAKSLEAVRHADRGAGEAPANPVTVTVNPAVKVSFNGADSVPGRLFGYHLASAKFESRDQGPPWFHAPPIDGDGLRLLELARPESLRPIVHTNFSAETGAGMVSPLPARFADAAGDRGGVMHTITNENLWARPRWMDVDPDNYAEGIRGMFRQVGELAWTPEKPENTLRRIEFWNEPFMWARHINRGQSTLSAGPGDPGGNRGRKAWNDPTQYTFMPGQLGGEMYAKFFNAAAAGLAETNPHVEIGGMSSGLFGEDFFSQLTNYVAHFLEACHENIDFLTEHHYSSHPAATAAAYEVVTGWSLAKHGKRWPIWNTEVNDLSDVAPGDRRSPEAARAFTDMNRAYYNYRDILELILKSRDKAAGRAIHALWGRGWLNNEGEQLMYLHAAALRGTIVSSSSDDGAILPVAAWENGRLAIYLLNDSPFPRDVSVRIAGRRSAEGLEASGLRLAEDASATAIFPSATSAEVEGNDLVVTYKAPLAPREIARILLPGVPEPAETQMVDQHFSNLLIADVLPGKPVAGRIPSDKANPLAETRTATLRIVARDVQTGEARIRVGDVEVALPASTAEGHHHVITDIPLPKVPSFSAGSLPVEATSAAGSDGWTLYGLSLLGSSH